jgi:hypothetical protein
MYVEIAKFIHGYIFQYKSIIRFNNTNGNFFVEEPIIIPEVNVFYKEIKEQQKKSFYNKTSYQKKKKDGKSVVDKKPDGDEAPSSDDDDNRMFP